MKVIKIANGVLKNFTKMSSYKVRYKRKFGPMEEESKILSIDSPEKAVEYIKKIIGRDIEILGVEEVQKPVSPSTTIKNTSPGPRNPRNVTVRKNTESPLPVTQRGFRINFYPDYSSQTNMQTKVYNVETIAEAFRAFKEEFPNGLIEGRPIDLSKGSFKSTYDEKGKPIGQEEKKEWWSQMKMQNRPREDYIK